MQENIAATEKRSKRSNSKLMLFLVYVCNATSMTMFEYHINILYYFGAEYNENKESKI